ncbi:MAG: hypothetical protein H6766_06120 [Candidatus Peribacteria bacterium]|nr:MAG: hypothetical protein H6766_06120 [Candidatus Peribacteria bacterium]
MHIISMIRRSSIRIIVVGIIVLLAMNVTFAADTNVNVVDNLASWLYYLISFLSWAWVALAAIAGKLMTNDLVFGGVFHMDVYLFKIWTIMKNFANFGLGFGFIFFVGRTLWSEDTAVGDIVKQV